MRDRALQRLYTAGQSRMSTVLYRSGRRGCGSLFATRKPLRSACLGLRSAKHRLPSVLCGGVPPDPAHAKGVPRSRQRRPGSIPATA